MMTIVLDAPPPARPAVPPSLTRRAGTAISRQFRAIARLCYRLLVGPF
jgi:hypothetical protein